MTREWMIITSDADAQAVIHEIRKKAAPGIRVVDNTTPPPSPWIMIVETAQDTIHITQLDAVAADPSVITALEAADNACYG